MNTTCHSSIPIDAFLGSLPKRPSICVGACNLGVSDHDILAQIARTWSTKSQRPSCVVTSQLRAQSLDLCDPKEPSSICWSWLAQTDAVSRGFCPQQARDVASLSQLKSEYGLILMELGSIDSPTAITASRLCDSLVMLIDSNASDTLAAKSGQKKVLAKIKSLQRPDCQWLGYWTIQHTTQAI